MDTVLYAHKTELCKSGAEPPAQIQVIPFGSHETDKGSFVLDTEGARAVTEAFKSKLNQMAIDYEHQSLTGAEAPAAGWVERLMDRGPEGLWAQVRWTRRAIEYLKKTIIKIINYDRI